MKKTVACVWVLLLAFVLSFTGCLFPDDGKDMPYRKGTVKDGVYQSEFACLTFTLPEGFSFFTEEELSALTSLAREEGEDNQAGTLTDFMAKNDQTGASVSLCFEKDGGKTPQDFLTGLKDELSSSADYTFSENREVTFAGSLSVQTQAEAAYGKSTVYQMIFVSGMGDGYMMTVTLTSPDASDLPLLEAAFGTPEE
ncbi:MAG: DUF1795 domain-containing protein [Clostridia bacterium]|nr:DUF1795 domain-containing protein [Clostridia bacterium]